MTGHNVQFAGNLSHTMPVGGMAKVLLCETCNQSNSLVTTKIKIMHVDISSRYSRGRSQAFTLVEVVMAASLVALIYGGIITAYILSARRAEWSGYSLAAQGQSMRALEQARQAKWDASIGVPIDQIISNNFPALTITILDLPLSGTNNIVYATNRLSMMNVTVSTNFGVPTIVKMIKVDTTWPFKGKIFTNTVATYIAPD